MIYLDTGCLLKLFYPEPNSGAVVEVVVGGTVVFTELHELELTAALQLKCFRKEASPQQTDAAIELVRLAIAEGKFVRVVPDWPAVLLSATTLAQKYSAVTGCRSLDLLHCALAQACKATRFVSSDHRQIAVAARMGLSVYEI